MLIILRVFQNSLGSYTAMGPLAVTNSSKCSYFHCRGFVLPEKYSRTSESSGTMWFSSRLWKPNDRGVSGLMVLGFHLCFLQMMWSYLLKWHWDTLQESMKQLGWPKFEVMVLNQKRVDSVYISAFNYGHKWGVMTKRPQIWVSSTGWTGLGMHGHSPPRGAAGSAQRKDSRASYCELLSPLSGETV